LIMRETEPKHCFIALIDLLGFSHAVRCEPLSHGSRLLRKFQSITRAVVSKANRDRESHGMNPGLRSRIRIFSDLVFIHTESDTQDDCMDIVEISSKVLWWSFFHGLLPRGAIAWGEMLISQSLTVGKPLVEVHDLESRQDWAGVAVGDSVLTWDKRKGRTKDKKSSIVKCLTGDWLIPWTVPLKDGKVEQRLAVNWLVFDRRPLFHQRFCDPEDIPDAEDARRKLFNTEAFYRQIAESAAPNTGACAGRLRRR